MDNMKGRRRRGEDKGISGREKRNEERERAREGMGRKKMVG